MKLRLWMAGLVPFILIYAVTWLPSINGPHLWFGMPSLFVWMTGVSTIAVPLTLMYFERHHPDRCSEERG